MTIRWNHNIHFHDFLWQQLPSTNNRALEIGCGTGGFSQWLARHFQQVDALDIDQPMIEEANRINGRDNITYQATDFMTHHFGDQQYDAIICIATLHHMPLNEALLKMKRLLRPSGKILILGLYRETALLDHIYSAASIPVHRYYSAKHKADQEDISPPTKAAQETLTQIKTAAKTNLPGHRLQRHLLWRYSLIWEKVSE